MSGGNILRKIKMNDGATKGELRGRGHEDVET
jgi:hypothetical protein